MTGLEICGHMDVKVPSKGRKFGKWKAWRRLWCVVRCSQGDSIQLILGSNHNSPTSCINIPRNAVLCRSESRSQMFAFGIFSLSSATRLRQPIVFLAGRSETEAQDWMLKIRNLISTPKALVAERGELSISLVDNTHARAAGLAGLYGTVRSTTTGVTIIDPLTGAVKSHWLWKQINKATLQTNVVPQDKGHIVTLQTSSEFPSGEGEIQLFCQRGAELEQALSGQRPLPAPAKPSHRVITSPLPPLPAPPKCHALLATRRLSRSEGDIRCWSADSDSPFSLFHLRTQSVSRNTNNDKVANSLITAGLGLMLTTPGCSEPDSLHDYQCLDSYWIGPADQQLIEDTLSELPDCAARRQLFKANRRESGVSIASGIYEEIEERPDEFYETLYRLQPGQLSDPPPLPPRKHEEAGSENELPTQDGSVVYSIAVPVDNEGDSEEQEPLYLPMSPIRRNEDTYVVMANLINQNNHLSEPVT